MPVSKARNLLWTNNPSLKNLLLNTEILSSFEFVGKYDNKTQYGTFFLDLASDITNASQELISFYSLFREHNQKFIVVLLHQDTVDIEKNHYFQNMLNDLGKDKPLHRLVFTKDLYEIYSPVAITYFDQYISDVINSKKIFISQKGDNLFFPLSLQDLLISLQKILFLSNTAGRTFWLLGDSLKDLELSYLIKKYFEIEKQSELEINAIRQADPKTNSLSGFTNQARGELNWNPEADFESDIKLIVKKYFEEIPLPMTGLAKRNFVSKIATWYFEKKHQTSKKRLPKINLLIKKFLIFVGIIYLGTLTVFATATSLSLYELENSLNEALKGNINISVQKLNNASTLATVGDSALNILKPTLNLIIPQTTEKIFNLYSFNSYARNSLSNLQQTYILAENLLVSFTQTGNNLNYQDLSLALHSNLSQVYENLTQIKFLSREGKLPQFAEAKLKNNAQYQSIQTLENQVVQFIKITELIPKILRNDKTVNILVLLQNSQILKPSGGQLDYYLLLTLNQGRPLSKNFFSPTEIDSLNLPKETPTPKKIKTPEAQDTISPNLNNDPDFSLAAQSISKTIDSALKIKPDFIIAVNDHLLSSLLSEDKSPLLSSFSKDLVGTSGAELQKNITDQYLDNFFLHKISLPAVGRTLAKMLAENQLYIWAQDTETERLISGQSYSGTIQPHPCHSGIVSTTACLAETTYLVETISSTTRQNPWANRSLKHLIDIQNQRVSHQYQITYLHNPDTQPNSGLDTVYDLYLPINTILDQLILDDLPASLSQIETQPSSLYTRHIIPISLNPNGKHTVIIKFYSPLSQGILTPFSYSITEYRQPGLTDSGIELTVNYPDTLRPSIVTQPIIAKPSSFTVNLAKSTSTFGFTLIENRQ